MTFVTAPLELISDSNSNSSIASTAYYAEHTGTVASATTVSVTLQNTASATLNAYTGRVLLLLTGEYAGTARLITAYSTGRVATIAELPSAPAAGVRYSVLPNSGALPEQTQANKTHGMKLSTSASSADERYTGSMIEILAGAGCGQIKRVTSYVGSSRLVITETAWEEAPSSNSLYAIYGEGGTATAGAAGSITLDGTQSALVVQGQWIILYAGTGAGQRRQISSIVGNVASVAPNWSTNPDGTTRYRIVAGWCGVREDASMYSTITSTVQNTLGDRACIVTEFAAANIAEASSTRCVRGRIAIQAMLAKYCLVAAESLGTTLTGSLQTILHTQRALPLVGSAGDGRLQDAAPVTDQRSLIVGRTTLGAYRNIACERDGDLRVVVSQPSDTFGHLSTTRPVHQVELRFRKQLDAVNTTVLEKTGTASASVTNNHYLTLATGSTTGSSLLFASVDTAHYYPGLALTCNFTAVYTSGVSGTQQYAGLGDLCNGLFFGYNGTEFGILHAAHGGPECRSLTITAAATGTGNVTVTLNGVAKSVAVVTGNTTWEVARRIAATDFSDMGWRTDLENATVYFIAVQPGSKGGTYSVSGQGVTGTFTSVQTGTAATSTWIAQSAWNTDTCFGLQEISSMDWAKGNIFEISLQWLGYGRIVFGVENPRTGVFTTVHQINYAGTSVLTSLDTPDLPVAAYVTNGATTSPMTLTIPCMAVFVRGEPSPVIGQRFAYTLASTQTINTYASYHVLSFRNPAFWGTLPNVINARLAMLSVGIVTTRSLLVHMYLDTTLPTTASMTWADVGGNSVLRRSETYVTGTPSGGRLLFSTTLLTTADTNYFDLLNQGLSIRPGETLSFFVYNMATSNSLNANLNFTLSWLERA